MARNIEIAIQKSVIATLRASGATDAEAVGLATERLETARAVFNDTLKASGGATESGYEHAFTALKEWATEEWATRADT